MIPILIAALNEITKQQSNKKPLHLDSLDAISKEYSSTIENAQKQKLLVRKVLYFKDNIAKSDSSTNMFSTISVLVLSVLFSVSFTFLITYYNIRNVGCF